MTNNLKTIKITVSDTPITRLLNHEISRALYFTNEVRPSLQFALSDEDMDVKALVKSWLQNQPEEERKMLETWLEDYFYKALEWVLKQNECVVESSLVGVVMNGLSHMHGIKVKQQFVCSLIRGLGANLPSAAKTSFAKEVGGRPGGTLKFVNFGFPY